VTSVTYTAKPPVPGWIRTSAALLVGWIVGGLAILSLYLAAEAVGAIGRSYAYPGASPDGPSFLGVRSPSDWPFPDSGLWTVFANVAVIALVLVLATLATAWWLRSAYDHFSEGRLALVLLLTGWLPLYAGPVGGLLGFLFTVWLVRVWVTGAKDRLPARPTIITVAVLAAVAGIYGLFHPFWTANVASFRPRTATIVIHNAAHVPVRVDGYTVTPIPSASRPAGGFTTTFLGGGRRTFRFAPRSDRFLNQPLPQGCGTVRLSVHLRYHIFGVPMTETVPAFAKLGHPC
jgi:hypothetical protein